MKNVFKKDRQHKYTTSVISHDAIRGGFLTEIQTLVNAKLLNAISDAEKLCS